MDKTLRLQAKGRVAVTPDRKTGDVLLHFTEPSGRRVEVRLTDASFESLAFSVAALEKARSEEALTRPARAARAAPGEARAESAPAATSGSR